MADDAGVAIGGLRGLSEIKATTLHARLDDDLHFESIYDTGDLLGKGSYGTVLRCTLTEEEAERRAAAATAPTDSRRSQDSSSSGPAGSPTDAAPSSPRDQPAPPQESEWAVKMIDKRKAGSLHVRMVELEIAILKRVSHPAIIGLREVYESPKRVFLILELCRGGSLDRHYLDADGRPRFNPQQTAVIIERTCGAVAYLHDIGITHRDLKLDNIMLASADIEALDIRVTDFGLCAVKSSDTQMQMVCGTPCYMAPEVHADHGSYSPLCDIWSLGIVMYLLLSGSFPYRPKEDESFLECIQETQLEFPSAQWSGVSEVAKNLIRRLLVVDPARRMTAKELLAHSWIEQHGNVSLESMVANDSTVLDMMKEFALAEGTPAPPAAFTIDIPPSPLRRSPRQSPAPLSPSVGRQSPARLASRTTSSSSPKPRYMQATQASRKGKTPTKPERSEQESDKRVVTIKLKTKA